MDKIAALYGKKRRKKKLRNNIEKIFNYSYLYFFQGHIIQKISFMTDIIL